MADFEKSTVHIAPDLYQHLEAALPGPTIVFAPHRSLLLESLVCGGTRLVVQDLGIVRTTKAKPFGVSEDLSAHCLW